MAKRVATPGVYVVEKTAFSTSSVALPTAIPAFVGYTAKAVKDGQSLLNKPTRITSMADYDKYFGGNALHLFSLEKTESNDFSFALEDNKFVINLASSRFFLYDSLRFYFANGGGVAYVVSSGTYTNAEGGFNSVSKTALLKGLNALKAQPEPTLLVIPDLMTLSAEASFEIQQQMLLQCSTLQNRFAILDVVNGTKTRSYDDRDVINAYREGIGKESLLYGAAYYPWVKTSIIDADEFDFNNIVNKEVLAETLSLEAELVNSNQRKIEEIKQELLKLTSEGADTKGLDKTLKAVCPIYSLILDRIKDQMNVLPPSGGIAGLYVRIDENRGVWKAPANESLMGAVAPVVKLTNEDQEDLNVTVSGKSINAIRNFTNEGTLVWGGRTLDGNSQDWKYINVRRTLTYIEQSVKNAARAYVFEPNNSATWVSIRASITGFLRSMWQAGGLAGGNPSEAFEVSVGLGSTMSPEDILEGLLKVTVKVALLRPAEFIVITFQQKMQES